MEFIDALRKIIGEFWSALQNNTNHTSDISTLVITTLAAFATGCAAIATRNSTKVSEATLIHTQKTSRRDEFISRYTLLLEQHKEQLSVVKSYLDGDSGKKQLEELTLETDHLKAFKTLQGHSVLSPYMRVLYHLLRHINAYYVDNASTEEKKLYSSTVRSLIRNDVLFLVAVNSSYVIEDNEENDYGKYQRLLRDFDFFEHALFFSAVNVAPGLEKDAVSKAGNKVVKALNNNHKIVIEYDKSYLDLQSADFSMPFIVSCIFDNPLHEKSLAFLNGIKARIEYNTREACEKYLVQYKSKGERKIVLQDFYGRRYFDEADNLRSEIELNRLIDADVYQSLPEVDDFYIEEYLNELKAGNTEVLPVNCYIRTYGPNCQVAVRSARDFNKDCEQLLSWQKHLQCVESRDADREFIENEKKRWSDFRSSVLRQCLTA
ncbi:putative phage abortive infection protein [Pantoea ananatis]